MTTAKLLRLIFFVVLALSVLASCAPNNEDFPFISDTSEADAGEAVSEYVLVISERASAELVSAADGLRKKISEKTGVLCYVVTDKEEINAGRNAVEIILGNADRAEAKKLFYGKRAFDYLCRVVDGTVVIGGLCDGATVEAINRFTDEILPVSDEYALMPSLGGFDYVGRYKISSMTLNGISIDRYSIVVDSYSELDQVEIACNIRDTVAEKTGFWINVTDKENGPLASGIYFDPNREGYAEHRATVTPTAQGIYFYSDGIEGIDACAQRFLEELLRNTDGAEISVEISEEIFLRYGSFESSIGSLMIGDLLPLDSPAKVTTAVSSAMESAPRLLLYGSLSESDGNRIGENLSGYRRTRIDTDGGGAELYLADVSEVKAEELFAAESDGVLTEGYVISDGNIEYILVRISGGAEGDISPEIPDGVWDHGLPVLVIVHTKGEGEVLTGGELTLVERKDIPISNTKARVCCYTSSSALSVKIEQASSSRYCEISVKYEGWN